MSTETNARRYRVILADPPWSYEWTGSRHGGVSRHYRPAGLDELISLDVGPRFADPRGAVLCMWATYPNFDTALALMAAWGFKYRTVLFTWVKLNGQGRPVNNGLGHYTRSNPEPCLLGVRGKVSPVAVRNIQQLIFSVRREHSRKPDEQYERLMRLWPTGPYLELYARQQWPGWDVYGNQAGKFPAQPFLIPESAVS